MWPTCEQSGYITPAILWDPISGTKSKRGPHVGMQVHDLCCLRGPHIGQETKADQHVSRVGT